MRRVVLVGNGLSTAANGGFRLGPLTTSVRARLDAVQIGTRTAREHLELIRDRLEADGHQDPNGSTFERLLGPLDRLSGLMSVELAAVIGSHRVPARHQPSDAIREARGPNPDPGSGYALRKLGYPFGASIGVD